MRRWEISRRTFLRGLGTAIALPMLEAMVPSVLRAQEGGAAAPKRLLFYYVPCGIHMPAWTPPDVGEGFTLSPILEPLAAVQDDLMVLSGLDMMPATPGEDGAGDHARGTGSFITGTRVRKSDTDIQNSVSVDQVAAQAVGHLTRFRSLELGIEPGSSTGNCDSGYSCAYSNNLSWAGPETPLAKETSPQLLFDRLFGGADPHETPEQKARRKLYKQSILDFVQEDAHRLQARLGRSDRLKLDEYLTGIRELELRLQQPEPVLACPLSERPETSEDVPERIRQMTDLMVLAFQCDLTRFITFMQANAGSNRTFPWLGIAAGHHFLSHHKGNETYQSKLQAIDTWESEMLAYLVQRMKDTLEPDGTSLLDNSLVFYSSEIADGNEHVHTDLPVILAGRGGGLVRPGRHVVYDPPQPLSNLFISMLDTVGVTVAEFGEDGDSLLPDLL